MKTLKRTIGLLVITALMISISPPPVQAQTKVTDDCAEFDYVPKFKEITDELFEAETLDSKAYEDYFLRTQTAYHDYMGCVFSVAEEEILQTSNKARDWLNPGSACLAPTEIKKIIEKTEPNEILPVALGAHKEYKDMLKALSLVFTSSKSAVTDSEGNNLGGLNQLIAKGAFVGSIDRKQKIEVDSALVAMDIMFVRLKELRMAWVMHVHFQCSIKYLEKYERQLRRIRRIIQPLPDKLRDASVS